MLNLLHLLAALATAACLYALWREARGVSQSRGYLMVPPPLAFGCALVMIGLTEPDLRRPDELRIAIAAGILLGAARGWFMAVDIDPLWSTVRLPSGSDGFWMAMLLALAVAMAAAAPLVSTQGQSYVPYAAIAVAFGAGFLAARAVTVYLRTRS
ncbi:hypothetical protein SAMN02990966_06003 [Rhodospirillales bacterium URHD0017]|nr:hypothetical protein SAMN02990966_06003 [Rhodospirillales bacterium URHD0017]